MKRIIYLAGLLLVLAASGCVIHEHEHYRGGAYDHYYYDHGHYSHYPYDRDRYYEYRY